MYAFTIHAEPLQSACSLLSPLARGLGQYSLPILRYALVEIDPGGKVRLSATDLDTYMTAEPMSVQVSADAPHAFTAPIDWLLKVSKVASQYRSNLVRFEHSGSHLEADVMGVLKLFSNPMDPEEFPPNKTEHRPVSITFDDTDVSHRVKECFARSLEVASTDETRYVLNGVFFDLEHGSMVATDGRRISRFGCLPKFPAGVPSFIWPRRKCPAIMKATWSKIRAGQTTGTLQGAYGECLFTYTVKFIEGNYPNTRSYEPGADREIHVFLSEPESLADMIRSLPEPQNRNTPSIFVDPTLAGVEVGNTDSVFNWKALLQPGGPCHRMAFDRNFLATPLSWGWGMMHYGEDAASPVTITATRAMDDYYVLMPMRVQH